MSKIIILTCHMTNLFMFTKDDTRFTQYLTLKKTSDVWIYFLVIERCYKFEFGPIT